eukprot:CAMPEP_0169226030 /NCGR_PEP_ID=MMETSP1016-20121227/23525_1 /TAXON_ID=342587 /ORGANISM="Karlodinium micrum, Strain CCMP2283" /LENGTH=422 /DNA_ID=CAMNT_0009304599 /DNA_START=102 /DNA_END=1371 /DNA_ORIENTATION=-
MSELWGVFAFRCELLQPLRDEVGSGGDRGGCGGIPKPRSDESATKVFVGGLSAETSLQSLQAYFGQYGTLVDSVVMKDKMSGRPRGFGFVTFDNSDSVESVMQAAGQHQLDGKMVEVKRCEPRGESVQQAAPSFPLQRPGFLPFGGAHNPAQFQRPNFGSSFGQLFPAMQSMFPQLQPAFRQTPPVVHQGNPSMAGRSMVTDKIFIGGLGADCSEELLAEYFSTFGNIIDHVVMRDKMTGKPRGFGFVQFDNPEAVDAVMVYGHEPGVDGTQLESTSFHSLDGTRAVEVKRASPKPGQQFSFAAPQRPQLQPLWPTPESNFPGRPERDRSNKVFVGGLGECNDDELNAYFSQFGQLIDCVVMKDKATGRTRGFGFVQYDDPAAVELVMLQQHSINGRWVEVKRTVPEDDAGLKGGLERWRQG